MHARGFTVGHRASRPPGRRVAGPPGRRGPSRAAGRGPRAAGPSRAVGRGPHGRGPAFSKTQFGAGLAMFKDVIQFDDDGLYALSNTEGKDGERLPCSKNRQREMTKFCVVWRT